MEITILTDINLERPDLNSKVALCTDKDSISQALRLIGSNLAGIIHTQFLNSDSKSSRHCLDTLIEVVGTL